jgi:hypothetical protein
MDIKKVPRIEGYNLPGSVTYGLNLSINYSSEPSRLTLNLVSADGKYRTPQLKSAQNISFGSFSFKGRLWGYSLKESSQDKTLDIEIVDNSIILDQYYVVLWKRGLLGFNGDKNDVTKTFDFGDESVLVPKRGSGGNPFTSFEERTLGVESVTRNSRKLKPLKYGNILLLGTEKFADSDCDIPDTYYTFNDLKSILPVNGNNFPNDNILKGTYEGTLRSVLNSWCSDLGYDFYWDYSNDYLEFYPVNKGIVVQLPTANSSNIISKETTYSNDGTFRQYGLAYTAMPKQPIKSLSFSDSYSILYSVSPISLSYLLGRNGLIQELSVGRASWGSGRTEDKFITAAFLGYVSRALRDFYCIKNKHWGVLGYSERNVIVPEKSKILNFLITNGFRDLITELQKLDDDNLTNFGISLLSYDESIADKWSEIEQELLQSYGKYYRIPDSSGEFFFCNDTYIIEISISVDPEGDSQTFGDGKTVKKIFTRGGVMSHDQVSALEALNYESVSEQVSKCAPTHILLKENGLSAKLVASEILDKEQAKTITHLVLLPDYEKIVKPLINLEESTSTGINDLESTWYDQRDSNIDEGRRNCAAEDRLSQANCQSAEEQARKSAIKRVGGKTGDEENRDNFVSGLTAKGAKSCTIKLTSGSVKLYAPSLSSYQVVCTYSINATKISVKDTEEFLWWDSNIPKSFFNDVSEIKISNDNVTDPFEDNFRRPRNKSNFPVVPEVIASTPQKTVKYVFAGEPQGVNLSPSNGLSNLDVSLSSEGFTTSVTFSSRPIAQSKSDTTLRKVNSQLNRASFNGS